MYRVLAEGAARADAAINSLKVENVPRRHAVRIVIVIFCAREGTVTERKPHLCMMCACVQLRSKSTSPHRIS